MTRIYTKTGDDGTTGLIGGTRVPKDAARIEAYGAIDELNAVLGLVCAFPVSGRLRAIIARVQDDLFNIGADLALPPGVNRGDWGIPGVAEDDIRFLEQAIDDLQAALPPLRQFILPGGGQPGAALHLARTVARRAERRCVSLMRAEGADPGIVRYLNRLSDLCFVMARRANQEDSRAEVHPSFGQRQSGSSGPSTGGCP